MRGQRLQCVSTSFNCLQLVIGEVSVPMALLAMREAMAVVNERRVLGWRCNRRCCEVVGRELFTAKTLRALAGSDARGFDISIQPTRESSAF